MLWQGGRTFQRFLWGHRLFGACVETATATSSPFQFSCFLEVTGQSLLLHHVPSAMIFLPHHRPSEHSQLNMAGNFCSSETKEILPFQLIISSISGKRPKVSKTLSFPRKKSLVPNCGQKSSSVQWMTDASHMTSVLQPLFQTQETAPCRIQVRCHQGLYAKEGHRIPRG